MRLDILLVVVLVTWISLGTVNGQITGREPACGCYCGYPNYESFDISPCTSRLREEACEDGMKDLPPDKFRSVCQHMQAKLKSKGDTNPCKQLFNKICGAPCESVSCYCGYGPDRGFTYTPGTANGRSAPSPSAPVTATLPTGGRYLYVSTRAVGGTTWFEVRPFGSPGTTVWVPGSELSCKRAVPPVRHKPSRIVDSGIGVANTRSTQTSAGRG